MGNPIPTQTRTIDPYASYNSDIANRLTRIITDGDDCLIYPSPIEVTAATDTTVLVNAGKCVKDDVVIEIGNITIDLEDSDFYYDDTDGVWDTTGYYYVVLDYQYQKSQTANTSSILVISPSQKYGESGVKYDTSRHLFLACLDVGVDGASYKIDNILENDPDYPTDVYRLIRGMNPNLLNINFIYKSSAYSIKTTDSNIVVTGNTTLTLPLITNTTTKKRIIKGDSSTTTAPIICSGVDTIEGNASISLIGLWNEVTLIPDAINNVWIEV